MLITSTAHRKSVASLPAEAGTAEQLGLRVDRDPVDVNLEMEVAAEAAGIAGFADRADPLSLPHPLAPVDPGRAAHMGVEVAALLAFAVDQQVVAVENRVVVPPEDAAVAHRHQLGAAGGGDVEAFVDAAAAARRVVLPDRTAHPMRPLHREDVAVVGDAAVAAGTSRGRWRGPGGEGRRDEQEWNGNEEALQWCSITRSTMLYSFASSALMK